MTIASVVHSHTAPAKRSLACASPACQRCERVGTPSWLHVMNSDLRQTNKLQMINTYVCVCVTVCLSIHQSFVVGWQWLGCLSSWSVSASVRMNDSTLTICTHIFTHTHISLCLAHVTRLQYLQPSTSCCLLARAADKARQVTLERLESRYVVLTWYKTQFVPTLSLFVLFPFFQAHGHPEFHQSY